MQLGFEGLWLEAFLVQALGLFVTFSHVTQADLKLIM